MDMIVIEIHNSFGYAYYIIVVLSAFVVVVVFVDDGMHRRIRDMMIYIYIRFQVQTDHVNVFNHIEQSSRHPSNVIIWLNGDDIPFSIWAKIRINSLLIMSGNIKTSG